MTARVNLGVMGTPSTATKKSKISQSRCMLSDASVAISINMRRKFGVHMDAKKMYASVVASSVSTSTTTSGSSGMAYAPNVSKSRLCAVCNATVCCADSGVAGGTVVRAPVLINRDHEKSAGKGKLGSKPKFSRMKLNDTRAAGAAVAGAVAAGAMAAGAVAAGAAAGKAAGAVTAAVESEVRVAV